MTKLQALQEQYSKAVGRLSEILLEKKSDIIRDSAIKRFEMAFDLSWKLTKTYLEERKGLVVRSPKECFREAYQTGLIDYDDFWMQMTDWRNESAHTYNEKFSNMLYAQLPEVLKRFQLLQQHIQKD